MRRSSNQFKVCIFGGISAYGIWSLYIWKGNINVEMDMQVLEQQMIPSTCLLQGIYYIFQPDNGKPHTEAIK